MPLSERSIPLIGVVTPFLAIAFLAVGVRLYVRVTSLKNSGWDDWLCLGAVLCSVATYSANVAGIVVGFGDPLPSMTPEDRYIALQTLWISPPLWGLSSALIKMSIIASYMRIWSSKRFTLLCRILLALVGLFGLTLFFGGVFACIPISLSWVPPSPATRDPAHCMNLPQFMFVTSILNTAADLAILAIPVPLVRRLQIAPRQRAALMLVFTIGTIVCIASIMRLVLIFQLGATTDPSTGGLTLGIWSGVENNLAIICACLPTLRPILAQLFPKLLSTTRGGRSTPSWVGTGTGTGVGAARRWTQQRAIRDENGPYRMRELHSSDFSHDEDDDGKPDNEDIEMGRIRVKSTFRVDVVHSPPPVRVDMYDHRSNMI
ncbi:hypothetical protein GGS26DRAFT_15108 [Hypomontagnella submonticulosa]|nr:hypothetical protein GGS26DRAFT_15108 [Hypomontagnella submonticulosa]